MKLTKDYANPPTGVRVNVKRPDFVVYLNRANCYFKFGWYPGALDSLDSWWGTKYLLGKVLEESSLYGGSARCTSFGCAVRPERTDVTMSAQLCQERFVYYNNVYGRLLEARKK